MAIDVGESVEIRRPASEVFDYLAHGENMPRWMSIFEKVEPESSEPPHQGSKYRYKMSTRGKAESTFEWTEYQPARRLAWHGPPVSAGPGSLEPSGEYVLEEHDGATRVTMRMHPKTTGLMSLLSPLMARSMRKEATGNMARLKQTLESGGA
jgi:uncharacterized membrane protein